MLNSELNAVNRNQQLRRVNNQMARSASASAKRLKAKGEVRKAARKKALETSTKAKDEALDELIKTIDSSSNDIQRPIQQAADQTVQKIREERAATSGFGGGGAYQSKNKKASDLRKVKGFGRGRQTQTTGGGL
jgi:hypothetical protein